MDVIRIAVRLGMTRFSLGYDPGGTLGHIMEGGSHDVRDSRRTDHIVEKGVADKNTRSFAGGIFGFDFQFACEKPSHFLPSPNWLFKQVVVDGRVSSTVLRNLMSLTEYQIAVFAIYAHTASEGLREPKPRGCVLSSTSSDRHSIVRAALAVLTQYWAMLCLQFAGAMCWEGYYKTPDAGERNLSDEG